MPETEWIPLTCILHGLDEIARYLHVHRRTVWRWIHECALLATQTPAGTWMTMTSPDLTCGFFLAAQQRERAEHDPNRLSPQVNRILENVHRITKAL
jgi:excisionase family DNA binding protein